MTFIKNNNTTTKCFSKQLQESKLKESFIVCHLRYLVVCSSMLSNKLYGVWRYSEKKPGNIVVLGLLNCPVIIENGKEKSADNNVLVDNKKQTTKSTQGPIFWSLQMFRLVAISS